MLGTEHVGERGLHVRGVGGVTVRHAGPREECELLGRVGMPVGEVEQSHEGIVVDVPLRPGESVADVRTQRIVRQPADDHLPRAAPERLVPVVEQRVEHVALAPQVHVGDLGLRLEHRPHPVRQRLVQAGHLLELVEDEGRPLAALGADPAGELEEAVDRVVDVLAASARREREPDVALDRVDLHRRSHPQRSDERGRAVEELTGGGGAGRPGSSSRGPRRSAPWWASASGRSTPTRIPSRWTSWIARKASDVLPNRRGARITTSWPLRRSAASSASSGSRSTKASSSASAPNVKGFAVYTCALCTAVYERDTTLYNTEQVYDSGSPSGIRSAYGHTAAGGVLRGRRATLVLPRSRPARRHPAGGLAAGARAREAPRHAAPRPLRSSRRADRSGHAPLPRRAAAARARGAARSTTSSPRARASSRARCRSARRPGPRQSSCRSSSASSSTLIPGCGSRSRCTTPGRSSSSSPIDGSSSASSGPPHAIVPSASSRSPTTRSCSSARRATASGVGRSTSTSSPRRASS